jgi:hypothetical protein
MTRFKSSTPRASMSWDLPAHSPAYDIIVRGESLELHKDSLKTYICIFVRV